MDIVKGMTTGIVSINGLIHEIEQLKITKQDLLVNQVNIKSINHISLVDNVDIQPNIDIDTAVLKADLTTTIAVGGVPAGKTYQKGTMIEDILIEMLTPARTRYLYWGETDAAPTQPYVGGDWKKEVVPTNMVQAGISHVFYTWVPGREEGRYGSFVYPKDYGKVKHIYSSTLPDKDILDQWVQTELTYENEDFYVYRQNALTKEKGASSYSYKFIL